jgi:ATP-dependent DNA helicase RecG
MRQTSNSSFPLTGQPGDTAQDVRNIFAQLESQSVDAIESEQLEIKGWCKNLKELIDKVSESSACLANARGGLVLVGIEDHPKDASKYSPCPYSDVNPEWLQNRIWDLTMPPVNCTVSDFSELIPGSAPSGSNVFAVRLPKTAIMSGHLTAKGVSKTRIGKECRTQYAAEDDRTNVIVPGATRLSLSSVTLQWAESKHSKKFRDGCFDGDYWELLRQGRLLADTTLSCEPQNEQITLAALLLFGTKKALNQHVPFFETMIISKAGTTTLRENIIDSIRVLCLGHNAILPGLVPKIDIKILMELVANCYVHRCYRSPGPVIIRLDEHGLEIENPGELPAGLSVDSLIHCVPVYRNLLLAEASRFFALCDKVGQGIDIVFRGILEHGLPFPEFESEHGKFCARIPLAGSAEFSEFVKRRSQSLTSLDEIIALRMLWGKESVHVGDLYRAMQRGKSFGDRVLSEMVQKLMIEKVAGDSDIRLAPGLRRDIQDIFKEDQPMIPGLWGQ